MKLELHLLAEWTQNHEPALQKRLCQVLTGAIVKGVLPVGARMPATRILAEQLGCSRNTVRLAYDQLIADGYLASSERAGTFVNEQLPHLRFRQSVAALEDDSFDPRLSRYGTELDAFPVPGSSELKAFWPYETDAREFPFKSMIRLFSCYWRSSREDVLRNHDPAGFLPLRRAITSFVLAQRGIVCEPSQIIVCNGTASSFDLIIRLLVDRDDRVWLEEGNNSNAAASIHMAGGRATLVPMDDQGLVVKQGLAQCAQARMAIVSPSSCYPIGTLMSTARRHELLTWAHDANAMIIEDDTGCEYLFEGHPEPAITALDKKGHTIYVGSFSTYLFPSLRMSYLILPPALAQRVARLRYKLDFHPAMPMQPVIASLIEDGLLTSHIRRMHRVYANRRMAIQKAFAEHLLDAFTLHLPPAGLNAIARPTQDYAPSEFCEMIACAMRHEVGLMPFAQADEQNRRPPILLGFGATNEAEIEAGVLRLADAVAEYRRSGKST
ncbi:PLP-dependent aminotransferase family protein [Pseudomonas sp. LFM046]|uniref:MocR-like pyridoxine biosynthesis transcription factor PdxR n=1 Tax=Pseudomonas sp. LFM046 TaxID=1608357 RepID=UPI0005CF9908|nr:PLP-dependent aminotransferase family protein [Pseudomonas sp. LFM046]